MKSYKRIPFLVFVVPVFAVIAATATLHETSQKKSTPTSEIEVDEEQWPLANFDAPELVEPEKRAKRRARSARFDQNYYVREPAPPESGVIYETIIINDWEVGLSALPADRSDVVVIGEITDAQAHLSNDKTGVYSEFTVRIGEVLKNDEYSQLSIGSSVTAERQGGRVRFPSHRILPVRVQGQGMPRTKGRYVLFLKRLSPGESYHILTGYELCAGRVFALDGVKNSGGSKWKFDTYEGSDEINFIKNVRQTIANISL